MADNASQTINNPLVPTVLSGHIHFWHQSNLGLDPLLEGTITLCPVMKKMMMLIHACMHTYIHIHTYTYIHTHVHTYIHNTYIRTIHTYIHIHIHTRTHTYIHRLLIYIVFRHRGSILYALQINGLIISHSRNHDTVLIGVPSLTNGQNMFL